MITEEEAWHNAMYGEEQKRVSRNVQRFERQAENGGYRSRLVANRTTDDLWDKCNAQATHIFQLQLERVALINMIEELLESGLDRADDNWYAKRLAKLKEEGSAEPVLPNKSARNNQRNGRPDRRS